MAKPLRPKRGTTAKNDAFVGLASEITIDTDKHSIRVHDGVTAGGHEILPASQIDVGVTSFNGQTGDVEFELATDDFVMATGARGLLAGYESCGGDKDISQSSPDSNEANVNITVANGQTGTAWTKVVRVTANVSVTLRPAWEWAGGEAPEITAGGFLVLCWCGNGGVANFVSVKA